MAAIFDSVIPAFHKEFTAAADRDLMDLSPSGARMVVGLRINDVTSGTTLALEMSGTNVEYDNLQVGEVLIGRFNKIESTNSTVDSVIVFYG
jgi:hypothetical protein